MKVFASLVFLTVLVPTFARAESYQTLVSCVGDGINYSIQTTTDTPVRAFLAKSVNGQDPTRIELTQAGQAVMGYGHTYIFTENLGRSGYVHFYANLTSGQALIDINRFLDDTFSTDGAVTNLVCTEEN